MSLAIQVRNYVTPDGTNVSSIRSKETLTASQNRLAELLKRLIQTRNIILMGSSSAFINANHAKDTSEIIKETFPPNFNDNINNSGGGDNSTPNPFVQSIINSSLEILKNSELLSLKNLNVSAMLDKVMEINMGGNIGDILKGTDKVMEILNAGLSVDSLSNIAAVGMEDILGSVDIESISKGLLSNFSNFSSSLSLVGLFDKAFNNISFSLDSTNISAKIGMFGSNISDQFNIGNFNLNNFTNNIPSFTNSFNINSLTDSFNISSFDFNGSNLSNINFNAIGSEFFNKSTRTLYEKSDNIVNTLSVINLTDTNTDNINTSVKSLVVDMCEFNSGLKCCTEDMIDSFREGKLTDSDIDKLTDVLDNTERTMSEIMKSLDYIVYLIDILIDIVKKIIDELIHAISLIKVECYDGKQACLCEVRI